MQINTLNTCGNVSNITQKSTNDFFSECYAGQEIFKEDTVSVKSFNKANIKTEQTADTSMSSASSLVIIIILVISGVLAFIMYKKKQAQMQGMY
jgi:hypothetical protein